METFDHAELSYLTYVRTHPDHYILNVPRVGQSYSTLIHSAECGTISTPKRKNYTTTEFVKIGFASREAAIEHAKALAAERGLAWTICKLCHAQPTQGRRRG